MRRKNWHWLRRRPINLHELQGHLQKELRKHKIERPGSTSLIIISHVLNKPKSWVLTHNEYEPNGHELSAIQRRNEQLNTGVPLPYVLGTWEFFGKSYKVTPDVLIPRPETERLVEKAIEHLNKIKPAKVVDVGTGSGVIAISLAEACPNAEVLAIDLSYAALQVASENALIHHQSHIQFLQADLFTPLLKKFDLIIANLPYIPVGTLDQLEVSRWEPRLALDGGETGLEIIRKLLVQARDRLASPGVILLEIEASLGKETLEAARTAFPGAPCHLYQDLSGRDRIIEIQQP